MSEPAPPEKHYPALEGADLELDAGAIARPPMPCAHRLDLTGRLYGPFVTWCWRVEGHAGECSYSLPRSIPDNDFKPQRKR